MAAQVDYNSSVFISLSPDSGSPSDTQPKETVQFSQLMWWYDRLLRKLLRNEYLFYWIAFHEDQLKKNMKLSKSPYSLIQNRNNFLFLQINGIFLEMLTVLFYWTEEISMRKFSFVFSDHNINTWAYLGVVTWKHLSVTCYSCGTLPSLLKAFTCKFFFHLQNKFKWSVSLILWMKETEIQRNEMTFARQHRTMTRFNISSD